MGRGGGGLYATKKFKINNCSKKMIVKLLCECDKVVNKTQINGSITDITIHF